MKTYTKEELAEILRKHQIWLNHAPGGKRADFHDDDLHGADLSGANLTDARLVFSSFFGYSIKGAPIYQVSNGLGLQNETLTLYAKGKPEKWLFHTTSFHGTRAQLEKEVFKIHKGTKERANYLRAIEYLWHTALANA